RIENLGCDVTLVQREPNLDRNPARCRHVGLVVLAEQIVNSKMPKLMTISVGSQGEAARRWQASMRQCCEVGGLRAHSLGIGRERIVELKNECGHRDRLTSVVVTGFTPALLGGRKP